MEKNNCEARREFVKSGVIGLAAFSLSPLIPSSKKISPKDAHPTYEGKKLTIICMGAHPGDPEFGCGGTMAKYSAAGNEVIFLYITRGEAYDDSKSYADAAALRTREAEEACKVLNATPVFLGQIDGNTELNKKQNQEFTDLVMKYKPDIVFTQWPMDSHPDHQVTGMLGLNAWIKSKMQFQLYFYEVNTGSETMDFNPTDHVDITDTLEKKKMAMFAHKSQNPGEIYDDYFNTLQNFRGLEKSVKVAEAFIHFNPSKTTVIGLSS